MPLVVIKLQKKYDWIDYEEKVADLYGFGATYIPSKIWREVYPYGTTPLHWYDLDTKTSDDIQRIVFSKTFAFSCNKVTD